MKFLKNVTLSALLCVLSAPLMAEQSPITKQQRETAEQLMNTALKSDLAFNIVESLTTEIGPRLGGSEAEKRARDWGVELGKVLGNRVLEALQDTAQPDLDSSTQQLVDLFKAQVK